MLALLLLIALATPPGARTGAPDPGCRRSALVRAPSERALRCAYGAHGPGRFGLLSYADVPVYQPATPMPGTHVVGVPGHAHPRPGESYEAWEWRILRTRFGPEVHRVYRTLTVLDPEVARRVQRLEAMLEAAGLHAVRRETWRDPLRQAYLFQQGRSRPGPLATATLTSWHSHVDAAGRPASRAVDYRVPLHELYQFHELVAQAGLESFGADSFDPGHVFLPDVLPEADLVMLRALPRVPEVTLSTGLPVDRPLPEGGRAALRERSEEFVASPFVRAPQPELAAPHLRSVVVLGLTDEERIRVWAQCRLSRLARPPRRSAAGGAPCAPPRSGGRAPVAAARSTGG